MVRGLKFILLGAVLASIPMFLIYQTQSQEVIGANTTTIYAVADSHVNSSTPTANYGTDARLVVQTPEGYTYVMFDLSAIPSNAIIVSATMSLYLESGSKWAGPFGLAHLGCYYCSDTAWTEETLTWENHPGFATLPTAELTFGILAFTGYKSWTVTEDVKTALSSGKLAEVLKFADGTGTIFLGSKESTHGPKLFVEYSVLPIADITLQSEQDVGPTSNLGYIRVSDQEFPLPHDLRTIVGEHTVKYVDGYRFREWEAIGDIVVLDPSQNPTTITVSGSGSLKAVGDAETTTYRYDDSTSEENTYGRTGEILAVRFSPIFQGRLETARVYVPRLWYGSNAFCLRIMDEDRNDLVDPISVNPSAEGWVEIGLSEHGIQIRQDFYVGIECLSDFRPYVGGDRTSPDPERSWKWDGTTWTPYQYDYMIRSTTRNDLPLQMIGDPAELMAILCTITGFLVHLRGRGIS